MKKRDKTKAYKIDLPKEIMPRRRKREMYPAFNKVVLETIIIEVFNRTALMQSHWSDDMLAMQPKTPTESFRFEILDLGRKQEVAIEELVKGPKLKLTL